MAKKINATYVWCMMGRFVEFTTAFLHSDWLFFSMAWYKVAK